MSFKLLGDTIYATSFGFPVLLLVVGVVVYRRVRLRSLLWLVTYAAVWLGLTLAALLVSSGQLNAFFSTLIGGADPNAALARLRHWMIWGDQVENAILIVLMVIFLISLMHDIQKLQAAARPPATEPPVSNVV
jgi:hypothetical protein